MGLTSTSLQTIVDNEKGYNSKDWDGEENIAGGPSTSTSARLVYDE